MNISVWTIAARADLADIDDYCRTLAPGYAERVGANAVAAGRLLAAQPGLGAPVSGSLRKWRVRGTPYFLLYRRLPSGIEIVRVRHSAEDWWGEMGR